MLLFIFLVILILYVVKWWRERYDPSEPPLAHSVVPVFGHAIRLLKHGQNYCASSSVESRHEAITFDLLFTKIYVIRSPSLLSSIQRNHRTLSFEPFLTKASQNLAGIKGTGLVLLQEKANGGKGVHHLVHQEERRALLGSNLDRMCDQMVRYQQFSIDRLAFRRPESIDLYAFCQHTITIASTDAAYGPLNPYRAPGFEATFWQYESKLGIFMFNPAPRMFCRKAWKAREQLQAGFIRYFNSKGHESTDYANGRWKSQRDAGAATADIAKLEVAAGCGILSNTVPSTFWVLFDLYSRPAFLHDIRVELRKYALRFDNEGTCVLDLSAVKEKCILLLAFFQEVLRLRSSATITRFVYEDTRLNDKYLLKAGSILRIQSEIINRHSEVWGDSGGQFDPLRFTKASGPSQRSPKAAGFLSFGLAPNMCLGRHFAAQEILAFTAMMILRFELTPMTGCWSEPSGNPSALASALPSIQEPFHVRVIEREEFCGKRLRFNVTPGKAKCALVVG